MGAQTLTTNIVINAKTGSGFSKVGATLTELGTLVNGLSQRLINFGEDSVKVYRDYEKSMRDAEVALSTTYGRNTAELSRVMTQLDASATEWAATTIFHTNDVANAIAEASHAGWDLNQIMTGLPAAMQLAQAGSLDLSEAVNYIVKATSAAGVGFEDLENFTDLWTFAANSSASTIQEFGEAMLRMGSTMRFTGSTEELMTLIAMTANAGSVGSEAGTMIRNSIMRLVAPTQKAQDAMAALGATSEETAEIMNNEALAAANAELAAHGFSAFDSAGNMKNVLDIYNELYVALGEIAGGYDNIEKNESALSILSSIFPTRTITEALTLLRAASNEYDGLYEAMAGGAATGYGAYAADTMMDTLNGRIETFNSKVERLKQLVGAELAPQIGKVLGFAGDLVDGLAEMDDSTFSALVSGLEVIAAAGPALLITGGALRLMGVLLSPAGLIGAGLITLTATAVALHDLAETNYAGNFGNMSLDTTSIQEQISSIGQGFRTTYSEVNKFREYLNQAVQDYESASSRLSSDLMTSMVTGAQLSEQDIAQLQDLGNQMYQAVQSAISSSAQGEMSYVTALFGDDAQSSQAYKDLVDLTNSAYEEAMADAEANSKGLREAMTSAFADGQISSEEYQNILSFMQSYNDAIAEAEQAMSREQAAVEREKLLRKAQTLSKEDLSAFSQSYSEARDAALEEAEDQWLSYSIRQEMRGASAADLAEAEAHHRAEMGQLAASYNEPLMRMWGTAISTSDQGDNYAWLSGLAGDYLNGAYTADTIRNMIDNRLGKSGLFHPNSDHTQLGRMMDEWLDAMGGSDVVQAQIDYMRQNGQMDAAEQLNQMYTAAILGGSGNLDLLGGTTGRYSTDIARQTVDTFGGLGGIKDYFDQVAAAAAEGNTNFLGAAFSAMGRDARVEYENLMQQMSQTYDLDAVADTLTSPLAEVGSVIRDDLAVYDLLYGEASKHADDFRINLEPEVDADSIEKQLPDPAEVKVEPEVDAESVTEQLPDPAPVTVEPEVNAEGLAEQLPESAQISVEPVVAGGDDISALSGQDVSVNVSADTSQLSGAITEQDGQQLTEIVGGDTGELAGAIDAQDGRNLTETVSGNTWPLASAINAQNGRRLTEYVNGDISALKAAIDSQDGRHITVIVDQKQGETVDDGGGGGKYASGGRATVASIFGEAGPEWAIPEEHTQRTAELLNAARAASGFTWADLLSRFGGLNANANNRPATIIYSPTVHAQDARGVDAVLREDKRRLEKWLEEKQFMDSVEVYA